MSKRGGSGGGPLGAFKRLDAYPKVDAEFFTKTIGGGVITLLAAATMLFLFISEVRLYAQVNTLHELEVDTSTGETIKIHINVTFPSMPCSWLSLDTMDVSGDLHLDVEDHDISKQRMSASGIPLTEAEKHDIHETKKVVSVGDSGNASCMSCYGAESREGQCCNSCDEVRAAYRLKGWALSQTDNVEQCAHDDYLNSVREQRSEGCKIWGHVKVNKVAGNFHFAPGKSYQQFGMHVHDTSPFGEAIMDFSHTIHTLAFGDPYPGITNPLDGVVVRSVTNDDGSKAVGMWQYYLKVVPTSFTALGAGPVGVMSTNQFSVTENFQNSSGAGGGRGLPGLFFFYDLSPIKVRIMEKKSSFVHFLTNVCAIVGGVFTVSGIIDAFVYQSERLIRKKREIGKLG